jgi:hypothetical protein
MNYKKGQESLTMKDLLSLDIDELGKVYGGSSDFIKKSIITSLSIMSAITQIPPVQSATATLVPDLIHYEEGEDVNEFLFRAISLNSPEAVSKAIEMGANLNLNKNGLTPLVSAIRNQDQNIETLLLRSGADPNGSFSDPNYDSITSPTPPIIEAVQVSNSEKNLVQPLIHAGANIYVSHLLNGYVFTPIELAVEREKGIEFPWSENLFSILRADREHETEATLITKDINYFKRIVNKYFKDMFTEPELDELIQTGRTSNFKNQVFMSNQNYGSLQGAFDTMSSIASEFTARVLSQISKLPDEEFPRKIKDFMRCLGEIRGAIQINATGNRDDMGVLPSDTRSPSDISMTDNIFVYYSQGVKKHIETLVANSKLPEDVRDGYIGFKNDLGTKISIDIRRTSVSEIIKKGDWDGSVQILHAADSIYDRDAQFILNFCKTYKSMSTEKIKENILRLSYRFANSNSFRRGQAGISLWVMRAFAKLSGHELKFINNWEVKGDRSDCPYDVTALLTMSEDQYIAENMNNIEI